MSYRSYLDDSESSSPGLSALGGFEPSTVGAGLLGGIPGKNAELGAGLIGSAIDAKGQREAARQLAEAHMAQQKRKGIGGIFDVLGTAASFIPGAGPLIGGAIKGAGGFFG